MGGSLGALFVCAHRGRLMPQVLKPEVRARILHAALIAFARGGFAATTMSEIAREAGMAVANLYRYYPGKEELFAAAIPRETVARFEHLLERSVQAHARLAGVARPGDEAGAVELLDFWIEQRLVVVILLDRAGGSIHEAFGQRFVERLVALSVSEIRAAHPRVIIPREARLVLTQIFENTRRLIAVLLETCSEERAIRAAVKTFRSYQAAGLAGLTRALAAESAETS
jgi:AcrR family transcriptional regulator